MIAAVAAPLLGQIPLGFKVPVVVLEVVLGIVIGPHVLDLVHFDGFVAMIFNFAMATTLFMAGMELDFGEIKGRPLVLALGGWGISAILAIIAVGAIRLIRGLGINGTENRVKERKLTIKAKPSIPTIRGII
jgi:Kef-type K+ transport system membrane component KefB